MTPAKLPVAQKSRLRLIVIQALVLSLFVTLFVRLYYLQVVSGEVYQGKAAAQSVRDIVVQPQRGLIVDAMGRPLVANRMSWVVSIDRTMLEELTGHQRKRLVQRVADAVSAPPRSITRRLADWNGSPYQPVPVAEDVRQRSALRILEQPEDYPGVLVEQQPVRAYPRPFGVNAAHLLGYLSPITEEEYDKARADGDRSVNGASWVGRAGVEK